jgi:hypothetical protein
VPHIYSIWEAEKGGDEDSKSETDCTTKKDPESKKQAKIYIKKIKLVQENLDGVLHGS